MHGAPEPRSADLFASPTKVTAAAGQKPRRAGRTVDAQGQFGGHARASRGRTRSHSSTMMAMLSAFQAMPLRNAAA